jgi:hypothetical protein
LGQLTFNRLDSPIDAEDVRVASEKVVHIASLQGIGGSESAVFPRSQLGELVAQDHASAGGFGKPVLDLPFLVLAHSEN